MNHFCSNKHEDDNNPWRQRNSPEPPEAKSEETKESSTS